MSSYFGLLTHRLRLIVLLIALVEYPCWNKPKNAQNHCTYYYYVNL